MLETWVVIVTSFAYLGLLFAIAYYADQRADAGRSVIASPYIYSLSLAVYATAWTFYGSVGRAAENGVGFLPIYIGPTLMIALWWVVMRKILRISKQNRITSLADFIASRYGKSALLGGVVTVIAVIGILPYISLQLKAVSASFTTVAPHLWDMAGLGPKDVSVVQSYENFTGGVLMSLVEHGFFAPEEANDFLTFENLIAPAGRLPLNTSGGNLAECYMHGLELQIEAVRQLRGQSTNPVPGARVAMVISGPMVTPVSSMILGTEETL